MERLRVLVAHNTYQNAGGEDRVVDLEIDLLRSNGHEVETLFRDNRDIGISSFSSRIHAAVDCVWSSASADAMRLAIRKFRPQLVHVHNTLAALSPSIYWAASECRVPVIQTLHNYRIACPQGLFLRRGRPCQDCLGRVPYPGIFHRCYRNSMAQSFAVATMLTAHRSLGTWSSKISRYIALSDFCRQQFIRAGVPERKICVKPNFALDPAIATLGTPNIQRARSFLFVGRLATEKGIDTLSRAMRQNAEFECVVAGVGPARSTFKGIDGFDVRGWLEPYIISRLMRSAVALVVPSICYETFSLVTLEAFAHGLPVIASHIGSLPEIVTDGKTGLLFEPGNPADLAQKMAWALDNPEEMKRMGIAAREDFENRFAAGKNYSMLVNIYRDAISDETI